MFRNNSSPMGQSQVLSVPGQERPLRPNSRFDLFMSLEILCKSSKNRLDKNSRPVLKAHLEPFEHPLPTSCRLGLEVIVHQRAKNKLSTVCLLSIPSLLCWTRPYKTSRVCAPVARASSWVSLSSRWRTASVSFSPSSFFTNFSLLC